MKRYLLLFALLIYFPACYYDNASELHPVIPECDTTNVTYTHSIEPIFSTNCGTNNSCHSSSMAEGGVVLDNYQSAAQVDSAILVSSIEQTGSSIMPPTGKLSDCNINLIKLWIQNGRPQ